MISFCYTEDGNYSVQNIPDVSQSIIFDKSKQLVRLFNSENFYFSVLSDVFQSNLNAPHTGFSQTGAYNMFTFLNSSIDARRQALESSIGSINSSIAVINSSVNHIEDTYVEVASHDSDSYDLAFSDEVGYVLVKFYGGHVATKNFDSSVIVDYVDQLQVDVQALDSSVQYLDGSVQEIADTISDYVDLRQQVYTNRDNIEVLQQQVYDISAWLVEDELIWSNVYIHFNSSILMANASINRLETIVGDGLKTPIVNQTSNTAEIAPNVLNVWSTSTNALTVTFATPADPSVVNEYMIEFTSNTSAFSLSLPNGIKWANYPPQIDSLATYQISIVNNLGVCVKYS